MKYVRTYETGGSRNLRIGEKKFISYPTDNYGFSYQHKWLLAVGHRVTLEINESEDGNFDKREFVKLQMLRSKHGFSVVLYIMSISQTLARFLTVCVR